MYFVLLVLILCLNEYLKELRQSNGDGGVWAGGGVFCGWGITLFLGEGT